MKRSSGREYLAGLTPVRSSRRVSRSSSLLSRLCLALVGASLVWAQLCLAAPNDAAVKNAIDAAMAEYAETKDADKADAQLLDAIALCADACKPSLLAQAWMYIGLVKGSGAKDWDSAREAFSVALGFDEQVELDPRFFSPTAQALFDGLKRQRSPSAAGKVTPAFEPGTQMACWPLVQEVETFRPIPIACQTRLAGVQGIALRYRQYGAENWKRVELQQTEDEWRGEIPCGELSRPSIWGMYVEARDDRDNTLERIGSRERPLVFNVVEKSDKPPPALPGEPAPDRCVATTYCPEDMVGTPACEQLQGGTPAPEIDTSCGESDDCDLGMSCVEGICRAPRVCTGNSDCGSEETCSAGLCLPRERPQKRDWFGVHFGADFSSLSGASNVCDPENDEYACFEGSDPYAGTPYRDNGGAVSSGLHTGTMRAMLSYDRFVLDRVSLGVRFGFAFSGAPEDFFPLHFEGRGTYYFGDVTRSASTFIPYVALGAGVAQVDSRVEVQMVDCLPGAEETCQNAPAVNGDLIDVDGAGPDGGSARLRNLDAYKSLGNVFGTISPGVMVSFSREFSGVVNLGVLLMTEQSRALVLNFQPSIGVALGF